MPVSDTPFGIVPCATTPKRCAEAWMKPALCGYSPAQANGTLTRTISPPPCQVVFPLSRRLPASPPLQVCPRNRPSLDPLDNQPSRHVSGSIQIYGPPPPSAVANNATTGVVANFNRAWTSSHHLKPRPSHCTSVDRMAGISGASGRSSIHSLSTTSLPCTARPPKPTSPYSKMIFKRPPKTIAIFATMSTR
jgi:hypothetical protein